jgi:hypothetical protein
MVDGLIIFAMLNNYAITFFFPLNDCGQLGHMMSNDIHFIDHHLNSLMHKPLLVMFCFP